MTTKPLRSEFEPGRGYTREDWDEAMDDAETTDEELTQARPFAEAFPALAEAIRRAPGRPKLDAPKVQVSLRLDPDVLARWRDTGPGWQGRVNAALRAAPVPASD